MGSARRWLIGIAILVVVASGGITALQFARSLPRPINGTGTILTYGFGCLGIDMDGGERLDQPIAEWPAGYSSYAVRDVLVDTSGQVILRPGDRVSITATIRYAHGDIDPCFAADRISIEAFEVIGRASESLRPSPSPSDL